MGVQRLGVRAAPCRSKLGCPRCPQWEAESPTVDNSSSLFRGRFPNLALVRPAFDLVLRRIRSLKRCVQACGCKIMTPRYAPQFGSRLHFKRCQALPKKTLFPFFRGPLFLGPLVFGFFVFSQPCKGWLA